MVSLARGGRGEGEEDEVAEGRLGRVAHTGEIEIHLRALAADASAIHADRPALGIYLVANAADRREISIYHQEIAFDRAEIATDIQEIASYSREIAADSREIALHTPEIATCSPEMTAPPLEITLLTLAMPSAASKTCKISAFVRKTPPRPRPRARQPLQENHDLDRHGKVDLSKSDIVKLHTQELVNKTTPILDLAAVAISKTGAAGRGITAAHLATLNTAITNFGKVMSTPRGQIVNRSALLREIETDTAAIVAAVSDLDDLALQFDGTEAGRRYIEVWKRARIIVDTGSGRGGNDAPPAPAKTPTP